MKLRRKLFASALAVAACAATLTTSTYAWYTTNTEVQANNIIGATAESGDASVFISSTGLANSWAQKVNVTATSTAMQPLCVNASNGTLVKSDGTTTGASTEYIEFTLYFKTAVTSADVKLGIHDMKVYNTTGALTTGTLDATTGYSSAATLPVYDNLLNGQTGTLGISGSAAQYSVDCCNALAWTVSTSNDGKTAYKPITLKHLSAAGAETANAIASTGDASNAHTYVTKVSGTAPSQTTAASAWAADAQFIVLPKEGTAVNATFRIFLNGADENCFDACKAQSFVAFFDFQVVTSA